MEQDLSFSSKIPDPLAKHYPAVYWFWHHIPSAKEIESQLTEIKEAGYRIFLIQPRLAFPRSEYLSEGYLKAYRMAMQSAERLGLTAGLYDDYNWISGHAGGRTVAGHDELRERQLFWSQAIPEQGKAVCSISGIHNRIGDGLGEAFQNWIYEGGKAVWGGWQILRVYACRDGAPAEDVTVHSRLADEGPEGCQVETDLPGLQGSNTQVIAFVSAWCTTSRLVNMLHPATAERFIEAGYEPYHRALGDYFGSTLTFLFIDQPYTGFYTWNEHFGNPLNSLMYDDSLPQIFREQRGYEMGEALLALVQEDNAVSPKLRCDFFETYGGLARNRFLKPLAEWTHAHGLKFAGHELLGYVGGWGFADGLSGIDARVNFGADYFAIDGCKDISGADACNYHPQISARFGASAAKAHGRRGCIVEQYSVPVGRGFPAPVGQWGLTLNELRCQAIRHLLYGAGTFLFHAYYQTSGSGNNAEPMVNPRFDFPPGINFEPWFRFHPQFAEELARLNLFLEDVQTQPRIALLYPLRSAWHDGPSGSYNFESAFWNHWLTEQGFDFDIIDEEQVTAAGLTKMGYRLLILPGTKVVKNGGFAAQVEKYVENGGRLVISGGLPGASQEKGADPEMERHICTLMHENPRVIYFESCADAEHDGVLQAWMTALQDGITVQPIDSLTLPLTIRQGMTASGPAAAIFNASGESRRIRLSVPAEKGANRMPERWFTESGERQNWAYFERTQEGMLLQLELRPYELSCFRFNPIPGRRPHKKARQDVQKTDLQETRRIIREDPAHICWMDGYAAVESAIPGEDGSLRISLRCEQKERLRLLISALQKPEVIQKSLIKDIRWMGHHQWLIEADIPEIPDPLRLDDNWTMRTPHEYKAVPIDLLQGWEKEHPCYSGAGYYSISFHMGEDACEYGWELECPVVHDALSVHLNQAALGVRGWPPFRFTLPDFAIKPAYNQLRIAVWNTAGNSFYRGTPYQPEQPFPSGLGKEPMLSPFVRLTIIVNSIMEVAL